MKTEKGKKLLSMMASSLGDKFPALKAVLLDEVIQQKLIDVENFNGFIRAEAPPEQTGPFLVSDGSEVVVAKYTVGAADPWTNFYPKRVEVKAYRQFPQAPDLNEINDD